MTKDIFSDIFNGDKPSSMPLIRVSIRNEMLRVIRFKIRQGGLPLGIFGPQPVLLYKEWLLTLSIQTN